MSRIILICILMTFIPKMTHSLSCKSGTPTLGKLTAPNLPDANCAGPNFEDLCYVMFTDYDNDKIDAWTYGCILKGSLNKCDKSFERTGVTNNYCCCYTANCNDEDFARNCRGGGGKNISVQMMANFFTTLGLVVLVKFLLN